MSWYLEAFRKYAVFSGRSRRKEYWYFVLFNFIAVFALLMIELLLGSISSYWPVGLLTGIYSLAVILPSLAVTVRRLHDIDRTGWWILIQLVPFGSIVILVFTLLEGTPGTNRYGPSPKALVS